MSRKKKGKQTSSFAIPQPSISWLPAFFVGLCLGILVHFIPGMDVILGEARRAQQEEADISAQPIMWRPQVNKHPYRNTSNN